LQFPPPWPTDTLPLLPGRTATRLFEDAAAKPAYKASPALPFMEYPPNLAGYAGDAGFDPLRFSDFLPMDFLREAELKHCRMSMLAVVGFAATDLGFRIYPLPEAYEGLTPITAHDALVEQGAMVQLNLWFSVSEIISTIAVVQMLQGSGREPGNFGFDPLGFCKNKSAAEVETMKVKELTNGRLAMLAFSGMITQSVLYDSHFPFTDF
jgi:Chlorophyll A-B binding protein